MKRGQLKRGPFTANDVRRVLERDGWTKRAGGNHEAWEHPTKPGKFMVSGKWTNLRAGDKVLAGMCRTCGFSKKELLILLNER